METMKYTRGVKMLQVLFNATLVSKVRKVTRLALKSEATTVWL